MHEIFAKLEEVLRQEHRLAGRLLDAARQQNAALRRNDLAGLNEALAQMEEAGSKLQEAEQLRRDVLDRLAGEFALPPGAVLSDIAERAPGEMSSRLLSLGRKLRQLLEELQEVVRTNNLLSHNALRFNEAVLGLFRRAGGAATYGQNGRVQDSGKLLSTLNKSV